MNTGERIRYLRKLQNLNTNELATKAGLGQSTISEIERGLKQPTISTLEKICSALEISLSHFFSTVKIESELSMELVELLRIAQKLTPEQVQLFSQLLKSLIDDDDK